MKNLVCLVLLQIGLINTVLLQPVCAQQLSSFNTISAEKDSNSKVFNLQECIAYAQLNNLNLKQLRLNEQSAGLNTTQARAAALPNANVSISHGLNLGRVVDPSTNSFSVQNSQAGQIGLNSNVVLYGGGRIRNTIIQNQLQTAVAHNQIIESENSIVLNVLSAYLGIVQAKAQVGVLEQQVELTNQQYANTKRLVDAGLLASGNLLDLEAQQTNNELNVTTAKISVENAYLLLKQTMNYFGELKIIQPEIPEPQITEIPLPENIYQQAILTQPSLKTADLQVQLAQQNREVARSGLYPTLNLSANLASNYSNLAKQLAGSEPTGLQPAGLVTSSGELIFSPSFEYENTPITDQVWNNIGSYIGLSLQVPIYNNRQVRTRIQQTEIGIQNAYLGTRIAENQLRQSVEQAYTNAVSAAERYRASKKNVETYEAVMAQNRRRFELGLLNTINLLSVENQLILAKLNTEQAKYEYFFRLKIIDFYMGNPIDLNRQ